MEMQGLEEQHTKLVGGKDTNNILIIVCCLVDTTIPLVELVNSIFVKLSGCFLSVAPFLASY